MARWWESLPFLKGGAEAAEIGVKVAGKTGAEISKEAIEAAKAAGKDGARVEPTLGKPATADKPRVNPNSPEYKKFIEDQKAAREAQAAKDAEAAKKADETKKAEYKAAEPDAAAAAKGNGKYVPPTRGLSWWSEFKLTYKDTSLEKIPLFGNLLKDSEPASLARDLATADRVRFGAKTAEEGQKAVDKLSDKIIAKYRDQKIVTQKMNGKPGEIETSYGISGNDRTLVESSTHISPNVQGKVKALNDKVYDVDTSWMARWGEHHVGSPLNYVANYPVLGTAQYAGSTLKFAGQVALSPITVPIKAIKWGTSNPILAVGAIAPLGLYERSVDYKHAAPIGTGAAAFYSAYGSGAMKLGSGAIHLGGEALSFVSPELGKSMIEGSKDVAKYSAEGLAFASVFAAKTATSVTGKTVNPEDLLHYVPSVLIDNPVAKVGLAAAKGATEADKKTDEQKTQTATQETDKGNNMSVGTAALGAGVKAGAKKLEEKIKGETKPEIDPATGEPTPAPAPVDNQKAADQKTDAQIEQDLDEEEKTKFGKLDLAGKKKFIEEKKAQLADAAKHGIQKAEDAISDMDMNKLKSLPTAGLFGALMGFDKNKGLKGSIGSMLALGTIFTLLWEKIGGSVMGFFAPGGRSGYDRNNRQMAMSQQEFFDRRHGTTMMGPPGMAFTAQGARPVGELRPVGSPQRFTAGGVVPVGELRPINPSAPVIQTNVDPKAAADQAAYEAMIQKAQADNNWASDKVAQVTNVNGVRTFDYPAASPAQPATAPVVEVNGIERSYGAPNPNISDDTRMKAKQQVQLLNPELSLN